MFEPPIDEKGSVVPPADRPVRLLIIADVRLYREGMHASLSTRPQFSIVGAASDIEEALHIAAEARVDMVIVDMAMKRSLDVVRSLRHHAPDVPIVGFGVEELEGEILACAEAGLAGYVPCDASLDDLVRRIQSVQYGELLCTPRIAAALFRRLESREQGEPPQPAGLILTAREREVLVLIDRGLCNKEIALELHIELSTVKHHVHNLLEKLHVTSRMQAAARLGTHLSTMKRGRATRAHLHPD